MDSVKGNPGGLEKKASFVIGQLENLRDLFFLEPLFGVWCKEFGFDGSWYNYMGYMERDCTGGSVQSGLEGI